MMIESLLSPSLPNVWVTNLSSPLPPRSLSHTPVCLVFALADYTLLRHRLPRRQDDCRARRISGAVSFGGLLRASVLPIASMQKNCGHVPDDFIESKCTTYYASRKKLRLGRACTWTFPPQAVYVRHLTRDTGSLGDRACHHLANAV